MPLLDMGLFKDRNLHVGSTIILLSYIVMGDGLFAVSLFLQTVFGLNAFNTGLATLPLTVGLLIFSLAAPSLTEKLNHKSLMAIGSIIAIIGCIILSYQFKMNITMFDLMHGMFILGSGIGFILALSTDISLINIPDESQNNASGIATTSQTLGESMGTAFIGIILILGVLGGIADAVDTYAPQYAGDEQVYQDIYDYFQKVGNIDDIKSDTDVINTADIIVQDAMAFVMLVTTLIMRVVFALTLRLDDKKIKH